MTTRLPILLCALALTAAACGSIPEGEVVSGEGARFVPFVAEFLDDSGLGNAIAVDAEGVPYTSYWIFPATLAEGEIPVGRPLGSAYITTDDPEPKDGAAIGVASLSAEGVWTRGAAAQVRETPTGVYIPYGPAFDRSLVGADAENTNGTDIAIDDSGAKHVVWTSQSGISYAGGADAFSAEQVYDYGFGLRKAGPIGRPSVAADADGNPWVAYTVERTRAGGAGRDQVGGEVANRCRRHDRAMRRMPAAPAHPHRRDVGRPDRRMGRHRRRRGDGLDAAGRRRGSPPRWRAA